MRTSIVLAGLVVSYAALYTPAHGQGISMSFGFGVGSAYPYYPYGPYGPFGRYGGYYRPSYGLTFDRYGRPGYWDGNAIYRRWRPLYLPYPAPSWYGESNWDRWRGYADRGRGSIDVTQEDYDEPRPLGETPPLPAREELSDASWQQLRRILRYGSTHLSDDLRRQDAGRRWIKYLQLGALYDQVAADDDKPPTQGEVHELQPILDRLTATSDNDEYQNISRRWGFRALVPTLAEYLVPAEQRERRQLAVHARQLEQQLDELSKGDRWKAYLAIPPAIIDPTDENRSDVNEASVASSHKLLDRFDTISKDPQYRVIAEMPSFKATHETLAAWIASVDVATSISDEQQPTATPESEPLPPPN